MNTARRPKRRAATPIRSIAGISVPADSPADSAMSDGDPPRATIRNGRNVNPLMIPTWSRALAASTSPSLGATLRATPADPNRQVRGAGGAADVGPSPIAVCARRGLGLARLGLGRPAPMRGQVRPPDVRQERGPDEHHDRRSGEEHERGRVAGPVVEEAREDGRHREPEAREQPDPGVVATTQRIDRDRIGERLPRRLEHPERDQQQDHDQRRPRGDERRHRQARADGAHLERARSAQADIGEVAPRRDRDREPDGAERRDEPDLAGREAATGEDDRDERVQRRRARPERSDEDAQGDHGAQPIDRDRRCNGRGRRGFCGSRTSAREPFSPDQHWPIAVGQRSVSCRR